MEKICPNCGAISSENELVCKNCSSSLLQLSASIDRPSSISEDQLSSYQNPLEEHLNSKKHSKAWIMISAIVIAAAVISASYYMIVINTGSHQEVAKFYARNDGPTISLQSSSTGNINLIPADGYSAVYGYYYGDTKIGSAIVDEPVNEIYEGVNCLKTISTATMNLTSLNSPITSTIEITSYTTVDDNQPKYMSICTSQQTPSPSTKSATYRWDREKSEMTYTTSSGTQTTNAVCTFPDEYWNLLNQGDVLEVGYSKNLTYTMDIDYLEPIEVTLTINILGQEDVSVQNGFYEDCYIIELQQTYELFGSSYNQSFTFWVTPSHVLPQAEITMTSGTGGISLMMKLDEYYTTESHF